MSHMQYLQFSDLILLIGTNPLPNFVVADYFLQENNNLQKIWLVHSEENNFQAGTNTQSENLERLIYNRWHEIKSHSSLQFPLKKISLSDVSDGAVISSEINHKIINQWGSTSNFHLNYTGGTKAMAAHVYLQLHRFEKKGQRLFSYLDANNFRLVLDREGIVAGAEDLRVKVHISLDELITLHDFKRLNTDKTSDSSIDKEKFDQFIQSNKNSSGNDGKFLERYLYEKIKKNFSDDFAGEQSILSNWVIRKTGWHTNFELDIVCMHGYHLTGVSCTINRTKMTVKQKGFEIIQRCRQIGGDETRAIVVSGLPAAENGELQEELEYDMGSNKKNILALGIDDLRNEKMYLKKIERFLFT